MNDEPNEREKEPAAPGPRSADQPPVPPQWRRYWAVFALVITLAVISLLTLAAWYKIKIGRASELYLNAIGRHDFKRAEKILEDNPRLSRLPALREKLPGLFLGTIEGGDLETARFLLHHGADPNGPLVAPGMYENGKAPLLIAATWGQVKICELLLESGARPDILDHEGQWTYINWSGPYSKQFTIVFLILDHGGAPEQAPGGGEYCFGQRLMSDIALHHEPTETFAKALQYKQLNINCADPSGITLMHRLAAMNNAVPYMKLAIQGGAPLNARDKNGGTPLAHAVNADQLDVVRFLADAGADLDAQDQKGKSILQTARLRGNQPIIKFLSDRGAR
jgi:hypothetical protein